MYSPKSDIVRHFYGYLGVFVLHLYYGWGQSFHKKSPIDNYRAQILFVYQESVPLA